MPFQMMRAAAFGALLALAAQPAVAEVTEANFRGATTGDLAALCGASAPDANRVAALAWCHGFLVGVAQYHGSTSAPGGAHRPLYCLPQPEPRLEQARDAFVAWAAAHPQHARDRAVDGLMRFAADTYPCPQPQPRR